MNVLGSTRTTVVAPVGARSPARPCTSASRGSGSVRNLDVFDINEGVPSRRNHKRPGLMNRVMSLSFFRRESGQSMMMPQPRDAPPSQTGYGLAGACLAAGALASDGVAAYSA